MNAYKPGTDWTMDMLRTAETVATLETPKERAKATLEALIAAEGRGAKLAAAPEMLEAAKRALSAAERLEGFAEGRCVGCALPKAKAHTDNCPLLPIFALEAAISKAEGRQP